MLWGISEMVNARAFKPLPLCSAPLKTLLVGISGALGRKGRSRGRSAKFELIFTTRCQFWGGVDLPNLNSSSPLDVSSGGRSAKCELIFTTRCQFWGVDLPVDLGVDLPNLNSSSSLDVSSGGVDLPNVNSSSPLDVSSRG